MKVFICLFALMACASASPLISGLHADVVAAPVAHAAVLSTGQSTQTRSQDAAGNYAFAYNEQHSTGGSSRQEVGSPGIKQGSYTLNVADGRQRVVNYVADGLGFRAAIATNEPGTAAQPAAATSISSPHLAPQQVAPIAIAAPVAEVAHHAPILAHHAPIVAHHAPVLAHHAPIVAHHAQVLAHHAPVVHAPVVQQLAHAVVPAVSHYSTAINHGAVVAHHAQVLASPVHHLAAPLHL